MQPVREHAGATGTHSQLLLSVEETADVLRIGRTRTYELVMTRKIQSVKVGRRRLVVGSSLVDFVQTLLQEQEFGETRTDHGREEPSSRWTFVSVGPGVSQSA
jgi:excisionase family DNA binding protein